MCFSLRQEVLPLLLLINYSLQFTTKTGTNGYITYQVGEANTRVIISAPHGGTLRPEQLQNRPSAGCYDDVHNECLYTATCQTPDVRCRVVSEDGDLNTLSLAEEVADAIQMKFRDGAGRPHVILSHLHRSKLDANRDLAEATFGDAAAETAWNEYHSFIDEAKTAVTLCGSRALYIDIHGQNQPENWTMIGVLLPNDETGLKKNQITDRLSQYSSIKQLHYDSGVSMEELVRGENSIGGLLQANGYKTVPSPAHRDAGNPFYFYMGGYSTRRHTGWTVSGFQVEAHYSLRVNNATRQGFAEKLADAINKWITDYYK